MDYTFLPHSAVQEYSRETVECTCVTHEPRLPFTESQAWLSLTPQMCGTCLVFDQPRNTKIGSLRRNSVGGRARPVHIAIFPGAKQLLSFNLELSDHVTETQELWTTEIHLYKRILQNAKRSVV